jgi:hypothetical protein
MTGLAEGPDGSLFIAADANQKIWRVMAEAPGTGGGAATTGGAAETAPAQDEP